MIRCETSASLVVQLWRCRCWSQQLLINQRVSPGPGSPSRWFTAAGFRFDSVRGLETFPLSGGWTPHRERCWEWVSQMNRFRPSVQERDGKCGGHRWDHFLWIRFKLHLMLSERKHSAESRSLLMASNSSFSSVSRWSSVWSVVVPDVPESSWTVLCASAIMVRLLRP